MPQRRQPFPVLLCCLASPGQRTSQSSPALRPDSGLLARVALGPFPSRPDLRRGGLGLLVLHRVGLPLVGRFIGTMELSDSLPPYLTAVPLGCARRAWGRSPRPGTGPPGSRTHCFRAGQGAATPPGRPSPRHTGLGRVACRVFGARRHLEIARFRGSLPCLHVPLSTLRRLRSRGLRRPRGQRGWLALRGLGLAPFTMVPVCPGTPERRASGAPGSGSGADAGGRRLDAVVRCRGWPGTALTRLFHGHLPHYPFNSFFSSWRKRQSVPWAMSVWGLLLSIPASYRRRA